MKSYHGELQKLNIKPYRALKDDLELTITASSYAGTGTAVSMSRPGEKKSTAPKTAVIAVPNSFPKLENGSPDFKRMTPAQEGGVFRRSRIQSELSGLNGDGKK